MNINSINSLTDGSHSNHHLSCFSGVAHRGFDVIVSLREVFKDKELKEYVRS